MKCRKCGYPLKEDDKFCSKCGARVIKRPLASAAAYRAAHSKGSGDETGDREFKGYTPPEEKFNWDVNEFPTEHRRTEEVNFDWNTFDEFHKDHSDGDEIAFGPDLSPKTASEPAYEPSETEEKPTGPEMWTPEETYEPEKTEEEPVGPEMWKPDDLTGEDLEKEIFEDMQESETADNEALKRQTAKIDKFYTFNKKNEEFQRLLDREYEKYRAGLPADEPEERAETDESRGIVEEELPPKDIEQPDQVKEMAEARASLFEEKIIPPPKEEPEEKEEPEAAETVDSDEAPQESEKPEESAEEPAKEHEEKPENSEEPQVKKGTAKKVWLTILAIVVIIVLAMIAVRLIAPDSQLSRQIDKIPAFFTGEQQAPAAEKTDRSVPTDDLTGVIQNQLDQNQNNAIGTIRYNAALGYDAAVTYSDNDIKTSKALTTNVFYKGQDGTEYYLDDAIVGAAIYYASTNIKSGGSLGTLEMGEIRKGSSDYYIWISADDKKEIFKVTEKERKMSVSKVYDL